MAATGKLALYTAVGAELTQYDVDAGAATLKRGSSVTLPANIHYVAPHVSRRFLYVASSDSSSGSGNIVGKTHHLSAFRIDPASGALTPHGTAAALPSRPIHITSDAASQHILVAFNRPSQLLVFALTADGSIAGEVAQKEAIDAGIFAHQIRLTPDDRLAILVTRGNDAKKDKPEDPGSLRVFHYDDGQLTKEVAIAPNGGYGFGPRHLDFHPDKPWVYVALERQNQLAMFKRDGDSLQPTATYTAGTLAEPGQRRPRQMAGTVRVHPNGRFVYVVNRQDATVEFAGHEVNAGGENSLVSFAIDPASGEPQLLGRVDTEGIHCRNFCMDPAGRLLAASHVMNGRVRDGDAVRELPCCISLFRIGDDGRLSFLRKHDIELGDRHMFWMGMVGL